jgi:hypothetical protein
MRLQFVFLALLTAAVLYPAPAGAFHEDFEDPHSFWENWSVMEGDVVVEPGGFGFGEYWAHGHATGEEDPIILVRDPSSLTWSNYGFHFDTMFSSNDSWSYARAYFYVQSTEDWVYTHGPRFGYGISMGAHQDNVWLYRFVEGAAHLIAETPHPISSGVRYTVRILVMNPTIIVTINGSEVIVANDSAYTSGTIGLGASTGGGGWTYVDSYYDNIAVLHAHSGYRIAPIAPVVLRPFESRELDLSVLVENPDGVVWSTSIPRYVSTRSSAAHVLEILSTDDWTGSETLWLTAFGPLGTGRAEVTVSVAEDDGAGGRDPRLAAPKQHHKDTLPEGKRIPNALAPGDAFMNIRGASPSCRQTRIEYAVPHDLHVRISVFDPTGRRITTLVDGWRHAGRHSISWNEQDDRGATVAPGIYFISMEANGVLRSRKMIVLR